MCFMMHQVHYSTWWYPELENIGYIITLSLSIYSSNIYIYKEREREREREKRDGWMDQQRHTRNIISLGSIQS